MSDTQVSAAATASVNFTDGTNNFVQTVAQTDINNATAKLSSPDTSSIKTELQNGLSQAGFYPILATFNAGSATTTTSANVGDQASTVTVIQTTPYTMFGVRKTDLQSLLDNSINGQIDVSKQSILSDGLNQAVFTVTNPSASPEQVTLQASATIGPNLNITTLKTQVAGKKIGQVESLISSDPGVSTVQVHLSPFWVSGVPNKTGKITIILQNASHAVKPKATLALDIGEKRIGVALQPIIRPAWLGRLTTLNSSGGFFLDLQQIIEDENVGAYRCRPA